MHRQFNSSSAPQFESRLGLSATPRSEPTPSSNGHAWNFWNRRPDGPIASVLPLDERTRQMRSPKMARLEAILLVADASLPPRKLAQFASLADATEARTLVNKLNQLYDEAGTPFRAEQVAGGYRLLTRPHYALWLTKLHQRQDELKLSPTSLETLAIIAYRQPVTRADIDGIRGVQSIDVVKLLMDRGLVRIAGEDDSLGRPFLYETTRKFLEAFGLGDLAELPLADVLRSTGSDGPATLPMHSGSTAESA